MKIGKLKVLVNEPISPSGCGVCADSFQDYPLGPITVFDKGIGWRANG
jgi:hypothetical protein